MTTPDRDPCAGCANLIDQRPGIRPYCQRGAEYGQVGCVRNPPRGRPPEHTGELPPRRPANRPRPRNG